MCCGFLRGRGGHSRWLRVKTRVARVGSTAGGDAKFTTMNKTNKQKKPKTAPSMTYPHIVPAPLDLDFLCLSHKEILETSLFSEI